MFQRLNFDNNSNFLQKHVKYKICIHFSCLNGYEKKKIENYRFVKYYNKKKN